MQTWLIWLKPTQTDYLRVSFENLKKDRPGSSYHVLKIKSTLPGDRPLIDIDYQYNVWNVLSLKATEDAGIIKILYSLFI